jgi:hypothetical protein
LDPEEAGFRRLIMPKISRRVGPWRTLLAAALAMLPAACGTSPITSSRIEAAIAPTFANLIQLQLARLGVAPVPNSALIVRARCQRLPGGTGTSAGAGSWTCSLIWFGPNHRRLVDSYELSVGTDACYTATVETNEALGGPTIPIGDGREVKNLLYAFEGCFDTTEQLSASAFP